VVEADESDGTFLELPRHGAIVTNIEPDHIEYYGSVDAMEAAFARFIAETPGPTLICVDDEGAARIGLPLGARTYGTSDGAEFQMVGVESGPDGSRFELVHDGTSLGTITLPVAGLHNARNACAAAAMAVLLGADVEAIIRALARFAGVSRRFEHRGSVDGIEFIDDYAHLPTEVTAAIAAGRDLGRRRVVAVYQPHRYSRTEALWREFDDCFSEADLLVVGDVYPAGEPPRPGVSGKLIVDAVLDAHPHQAVAYMPRRADLVSYLRSVLRPGDLCLTLGAGDLTSLPDELIDGLGGQGSANP
jgi:UDP-N-acetylmuramate--alanine ligase